MGGTVNTPVLVGADWSTRSLGAKRKRFAPYRWNVGRSWTTRLLGLGGWFV